MKTRYLIIQFLSVLALGIAYGYKNGSLHGDLLLEGCAKQNKVYECELVAVPKGEK